MKLNMICVMIAVLTIGTGLNGILDKSEAVELRPSVTGLLLLCSSATEKPQPPEKNPPGDIPDNQVFVKYAASGYELDVPEGWARTTSGTDVTFGYRFDGVSVRLTDAAAAPSVESIRRNQAEQLKATGRAVKIKHVETIKLPHAQAVVMEYESNSEPDPVVNKQVRLEASSYFYYKNGKLAELSVWAPLGADNADQWRRISGSFRWR